MVYSFGMVSVVFPTYEFLPKSSFDLHQLTMFGMDKLTLFQCKTLLMPH